MLIPVMHQEKESWSIAFKSQVLNVCWKSCELNYKYMQIFRQKCILMTVPPNHTTSASRKCVCVLLWLCVYVCLYVCMLCVRVCIWVCERVVIHVLLIHELLFLPWLQPSRKLKRRGPPRELEAYVPTLFE